LVLALGIIANPVSARDIRRVVARAASLQIADRANIVLRVLTALRACGITEVLMMPEHGGIRPHVERALARTRHRGEAEFPAVHYLPMHVSGTVEDTWRATIEMRRAGVAAIIVLGGDGTHRAVAKHCGAIPICGISTGTNNAFPEHREPTITGIAAALAVTGRVPPGVALASNKRVDIAINNGEVRDIALVDVAIVAEHCVGARALWRPDTFRELFVTFADPQAIGMSAIAALIEPVSRSESGGLVVRLAPARQARLVLNAPIAPGLIVPIGFDDWRRMPPDVPFIPAARSGAIALDGERDLAFSERDRVVLTLRDDAFRTLNVSSCMQYAARNGLLRSAGGPIVAPS
jgi:predicted polyphosphate/ATP-dependent NAD kinase